MVIESLPVQTARIPRFVGIETPPQLFFTVNDGKHKQSMKVIDALALDPLHSTAPGNPLYVTYENWASVPNDISDNSVFVFDERLGEKNCFFPLCWQENHGRRHILHFHRIQDVLWGFGVNLNLTESRIPQAMNQLKTDFGRNFIKNLNGGGFPWGPAPTEETPAQRQKRKKKKEKSRVDLEEFGRLW